MDRIFRSLARVVVASAESRQAQTCAELIQAFASVVPRLQSPGDRAAFEAALDSVLPAVIQHAELPKLKETLGNLEQALHRHELEAARVSEVRALLTEAPINSCLRLPTNRRRPTRGSAETKTPLTWYAAVAGRPSQSTGSTLA